MDQKQTACIGIYQIDVYSKLFESKNHAEIIQFIVNEYNRKAELKSSNISEKLSIQKLNPNIDTQGFYLEIYYSSKYRSPSWKNFLSYALDPSCELLHGQNHDILHVSFFSKDDCLFAITGGQGNFVVQEYISDNFGLEIIEKIIMNDEPVIKSLQERGLVGATLASNRQFRRDQKISDEEGFGKFYKQITAQLNPQLLQDIFGFSHDETKKYASCVAKSSFKINKSVQFDKLLLILNKLLQLTKQQAKFKLNSSIIITRRTTQGKLLIPILRRILIEKLYSYCQSKKNLDFDFCAKDIDNYIISQKIEVSIKNSSKKYGPEDIPESLSELLNSLLNNNLFQLSDIVSFEKQISRLEVITYNDSSEIMTKGSFLEYIHGEISYNGKTYFYLDGEWHQLEDTFLTDLNSSCSKIIQDSTNLQSILFNTMDVTKSEDDYNLSYLGKDDYLVLHKIQPEYIELCDIVKFEGNNIYLIHVKKGFDNSVRELANQIYLSAKRLQSDLKSGDKKYLQKIISGLKAGGDIYRQKLSQQDISTDEFIRRFGQENKITYCAAIVDTEISIRNFTQITKYQSNIAKFSLTDLSRNLKQMDYQFGVIEIGKY